MDNVSVSHFKIEALSDKKRHSVCLSSQTDMTSNWCGPAVSTLVIVLLSYLAAV